MDYGLKGKNVLVTGSTKGLGEAIVRILAGEGANVIVSGRSEDLVKELSDKFRAEYGVNAVGIPADLGREGAAEKLFEESVTALGGLDIL